MSISKRRSGWVAVGNLDFKELTSLGNELEDLSNKKISPQRRKEIAEFILEKSTEFIPLRTGALRDSGKVTNIGSLYWSSIWHYETKSGKRIAFDYAGIQYDNEYFNHTAPQTDHWVEKTIDYYKDDIAQKVVDVFTRRRR